MNALVLRTLPSAVPAQTTSSAEPSPAFPANLPGGEWSLYGGGAVGGVLVLLLLLRLFRRKPVSREPKAPAELAASSTTKPLARVELPKSDEENAQLRQAEERRAEAQKLAAERKELAQEARRSGDSSERARLEHEARALKEKEEAAKREEYRARKAAEDETRERKKREVEETERLRQEEAARAREAEAAKKAEEARAAEEKLRAESGRTLSQGLDKTRSQGFMSRLNTLFGTNKALDESVLVELEEILFTADIGVKTASNLVELAREKARKNELSSSDKIRGLIRSEITRILGVPVTPTIEGGGPPHVLMVVGVNGAGKTTTIGKLAAKAHAEGKTVILAAGDTFRAAAAEQLDVWAARAQAEIVSGKDGADPSSVIFEAIKRAQEVGAQLVIADTAGRLHTQAPLMEELKKIKRVMGKALPGAPHSVLLVLDATMGQNAIAQAKQFHEAVGVTAIALTKLDGTAKGGVVIGISDELKLPVCWVGVGEKVADLRPFQPEEFVEALFE